jgi:DNA primase
MASGDVQKIKERLSIDEVVGSYLKLTRSGSGTLKGLCPFHNEKSPSFNVSTDRGMYYCFGCGKGGDIITFVQEMESYSFAEALTFLAEKAGSALGNDFDPQEDSRKKRLREVLRETIKLYEFNIRKQPEIVSYLENRGISKETISLFHVGYAPKSFQYASEYLKKKKFKTGDLLEAGIATQGKRGLYDRFRERIMFPIYDAQENPVGFSGRIAPLAGSDTDTTKVGKYVNTSETTLYHKSKVVYGLHLAKRSILKKGRVILVEGQIDVVLAHQHGFTETVALSGTALTEQQVVLLKRYSDDIILVLDGDEAGKKAARRSVEVLYKLEMRPHVVFVSGGKDPADILHAQGAGGFEKILASAKEYTAARIEDLSLMNLDAREVERAVKNDLYPLLHINSSPIVKDRLIQKIAALLSVSAQGIREDYSSWLRKGGEQISIAPAAPSGSVGKDEKSVKPREILQAALESFYEVETFTQELQDDIKRILSPIKEVSVSAHVFFLMEEQIADKEDKHEFIVALVDRINLQEYREKRVLLKTELGRSSGEQALEVLKQLQSLDQKIDKITQNRSGL